MFSKRGLEPPRFNRLEARDGKRKKKPGISKRSLGEDIHTFQKRVLGLD